MAWPPPVLPVNRTDSLDQQGNHPADHNAVNQAVNDTVAHIQAAVKAYGSVSTVTTDAFGNATIGPPQGVPAGARISGAVAIGAQRDFAIWCVLNNTDIPLGSNQCAFNLKRTDGIVVANTPVSLSWLITYT